MIGLTTGGLLHPTVGGTGGLRCGGYRLDGEDVGQVDHPGSGCVSRGHYFVSGQESVADDSIVAVNDLTEGQGAVWYDLTGRLPFVAK